jgi:methionyl-tRNA formyltransferase
MKPERNIMVCAVGLKGATFVEGLLKRDVNVGLIATYQQADDRTGGFKRIRDLAASHSIEILETRHPVLQAGDLVFLVGWQYLLPTVTPTTIVFHDSILPRYRGFAPTVTALINGDREIGVTALIPKNSVDAGPIIAQRAIPVSYPVKIQAALEQQAGLMIDIAAGIIEQWRHDRLNSTPQPDSGATYSIWRDDADYQIDWTESADEIERFVNAVGHPYAGARTTVGGTETIRISDVTALPDLHFEIRDAGKIWSLENGRATVICGAGMLRIDRCCREDGSVFLFRRLRTRLGPS